MSKHTPGPWTWTTDSAGPEDEYGCKTRGPVDMDTFESTGYSNNPELYAGDVCILSGGSGEYNPLGSTSADAHLIAAAPEMYEALKAAENALRDHVQYEEPEEGSAEGYAWNMVRAALAKAEGTP